MVIAPDNFKDEEYYTPRYAFEERGITVKTASTKQKAISVSGKIQKTDLMLKDAKTDYDAILFIGGPGAAVYFNNKDALNLAKKAYENNKIVGAICIAPSILANVGILKGKNATVFPSEESNLREKGAKYIAQDVIVDGRIITANGPSASAKFAKEIISKL